MEAPSDDCLSGEEKGVIQYPTRAASFKRWLGGEPGRAPNVRNSSVSRGEYGEREGIYEPARPDKRYEDDW
jgi:hypothetical protein